MPTITNFPDNAQAIIDLYKSHLFCHTCGTRKRELKICQIIGNNSHITDVESAPLNSRLICQKCFFDHDRSEENLQKTLMNTLLFLMSIKYKLTNKDMDFYLKYNKYYKYYHL